VTLESFVESLIASSTIPPAFLKKKLQHRHHHRREVFVVSLFFNELAPDRSDLFTPVPEQSPAARLGSTMGCSKSKSPTVVCVAAAAKGEILKGYFGTV